MTADLEQRLGAAFAAPGEPALTEERRRALGPALRRRRAHRQRVTGAVFVSLLVVGLAAGLPLGFRSTPRPVALRQAGGPSAACVEVQVGGAASCQGALVGLSGPAAQNAAAPFSPASPAPSTSGGSSALKAAAPAPLDVAVGTRLVVTLPSRDGVRWASVAVLPATSNGPVEHGARQGAVTIRSSRVAGKTVATVVAAAPGEVALGARGFSSCPTASAPCAARAVSWSLVLRVAPKLKVPHQ